jgi:tetratricopeptide (TPR) repeat protein
MQPKSAEQVLESRCSRMHENPLNLLFLLPGTVFLVFALTLRRRRRLPSLILAILLIWAAGLATVRDTAAVSDLELRLREAEAAYTAGRAEEALALYQEAASRLPCNPALEHNLGICYAAVGRTGDAVLHLRRSLSRRPGDEASRRALQLVEEQAELEGQLPMPVSLNPDVLFVLTLVLANASLGAAGFAVRRKGVRALIVMILLIIAAGISLGFFVGLLYVERRPVGIVVADNVSLVKIPEEDARPSFVLPPGTSLRIRGRAGEYYLVETASQFRGWVHSGAIVLD